MDTPKPYEIPKKVVLDAFQRVKENQGAPGIDGQSIEMFEVDLKNNLYRIWNRMSSGSYFPPPVKAVEIPKKAGDSRMLGVPTVTDRVAQMVVKMTLEPVVEPIFHPDSYGYRPGRSAIQALGVTRRRCWQYDWVLEFDIKGLFDNIDHDLLMRAVRWHVDNPWVLLYIERWLKAPFHMPDGTIKEREKGTPQGGVVSPVLANLFLHYAFDAWMVRTHPDKPFARYADDAVVHCRTEADAVRLKADLETRLAECGLELNLDKTRVIYCQDDDRRQSYPNTSFDFLGYTFRPRRSKTGEDRYFINFSPAVSRKAQKAMRRTVHDWRMHLKSDKTVEDLSRMFNPVIRGWIQYYGRFYKSELYHVLRYIDRQLARWAKRKYKKLARGQLRATHWLGKVARRQPTLFLHWQMGVRPAAG
jgi:RNA-directed DNA polymerase